MIYNLIQITCVYFSLLFILENKLIIITFCFRNENDTPKIKIST